MDAATTSRSGRTFRPDRRFLLAMAAGLGIALLGISLIAAAGVIEDDGAGEIEGLAPGAISIGDEQARAIVLAAYAGAAVVEVDLDTTADGTVVYDVSIIDSGGTAMEIMVNARTGAVLGVEHDDDDSHDDDD